MEIVNINFEENLIVCINGDMIKLVTFKTLEHGHIKFGVDAPRNVNVHREEVFNAIKKQETMVENSEA